MPLNGADVKFLKGMIPHHKMAIEMAEIVIEFGADLRVDGLARAIRDGQTKEITQMEGFLKEVGENPNDSMEGM